jgi:hypothetical protein
MPAKQGNGPKQQLLSGRGVQSTQESTYTNDGNRHTNSLHVPDILLLGCMTAALTTCFSISSCAVSVASQKISACLQDPSRMSTFQIMHHSPTKPLYKTESPVQTNKLFWNNDVSTPALAKVLESLYMKGRNWNPINKAMRRLLIKQNFGNS